MTLRSLVGRALVAPVALLPLLAACAAGAHGPGEARIEVIVQNDLIPRTPVTVRVVLDTGNRLLLGDVQPSRSRLFRFSNPSARSGMQLVAERAGGSQIVSSQFNAYPGDQVTWSVETNLVRVGEQDIPNDER